jgi:hypothetical protein
MGRARQSDRGRSASRRRTPTPGRHSGPGRSEEARIDRLANGALKELLKLQQQTSNRSGVKWACNCGYKTNFSDRTACYRCSAKKGEGKAPPALGPSQRVVKDPPPATPAPAAAAAAVAGTQPSQYPLSADSDLEACRRASVDRLRSLKHLLDTTPGDPSLARWVGETEQEIASIKARIHALKTPAARLQACLTKKTAADKEVGQLEEVARAAAEALDLANGKLSTARHQLSELEIELRDLRLDGLLGHPPAEAAVPKPVDLMAFATAIMKAVAPGATLSTAIVEQMAAMCNLAAAAAEAPRSDAIPASFVATGGVVPDRSRSPSGRYLRAARSAASTDMGGSASMHAPPFGGAPPVQVTDPTQQSGAGATPLSTAPRGARLPGVGAV